VRRAVRYRWQGGETTETSCLNGISPEAFSVNTLGSVENARIQKLLAGGQRKLLGLVGAPGAGKSTLAALLRDALGAERALNQFGTTKKRLH